MKNIYRSFIKYLYIVVFKVIFKQKLIKNKIELKVSFIYLNKIEFIFGHLKYKLRNFEYTLYFREKH